VTKGNSRTVNDMRTIDADEVLKHTRRAVMFYWSGEADTAVVTSEDIKNAPTIDAVPVIRCEKCEYASPYKRMDGETGYYCMNEKNSFVYGQYMERTFHPVKEADDFCSYGKQRCNEG